jgi:hypothetical protein
VHAAASAAAVHATHAPAVHAAASAAAVSAAMLGVGRRGDRSDRSCSDKGRSGCGRFKEGYHSNLYAYCTHTAQPELVVYYVVSLWNVIQRVALIYYS